ncbi:MAG: hypothetical protein AAFZ10_04380, partial [Pseudomonadota bacterium]
MENGEIYLVQMYERVDATGLRGTEVKYKRDYIEAPGQISSVTAFSGLASDTGLEVSVKYKCKKLCFPTDGKYKDKPGVRFEAKVTLSQIEPANICASHDEAVYTNTLTNTDHWNACDPQSGHISAESKPSDGSVSTLKPDGSISPSQTIE